MEGRVVVEENTPKKRLCSRVAQVAEAGPEGVAEVKPKRSRMKATQGPLRADHAIGSALIKEGGVSCFCDCWFKQVDSLTSRCKLLHFRCRSSDLSLRAPLKNCFGFAGFTASDNLCCLYQRGTCTETGK